MTISETQSNRQPGTRDHHAVHQAPHRLLTIQEAAAYLNVPARWVAEAVRLRRIRCTRIGKHVRFRLEHLDELIEAGEQPVTAPAALSLVSAARHHSGRSRL